MLLLYASRFFLLHLNQTLTLCMPNLLEPITQCNLTPDMRAVSVFVHVNFGPERHWHLCAAAFLPLYICMRVSAVSGEACPCTFLCQRMQYACMRASTDWSRCYLYQLAAHPSWPPLAHMQGGGPCSETCLELCARSLVRAVL